MDESHVATRLESVAEVVCMKSSVKLDVLARGYRVMLEVTKQLNNRSFSLGNANSEDLLHILQGQGDHEMKLTPTIGLPDWGA